VHSLEVHVFIENEEIFYIWKFYGCGKGTVPKKQAYEPVISLYSEKVTTKQ